MRVAGFTLTFPRLPFGIMGSSPATSSSNKTFILLGQINTTEVIFFFLHSSAIRDKRVWAWEMKADSWSLKDSVKTTTVMLNYQKAGQRLNTEIEVNPELTFKEVTVNGTMAIVPSTMRTQGPFEIMLTGSSIIRWFCASWVFLANAICKYSKHCD